jgi:hypothetical protein
MTVVNRAREDTQVAPPPYDDSRLSVAGHGEQQRHLCAARAAMEDHGMRQVPGRPTTEFPSHDTSDYIATVTGLFDQLFQRRTELWGQLLPEGEIGQRLTGDGARLGQIAILSVT